MIYFYTTGKIQFPKKNILHDITKCFSGARVNQLVENPFEWLIAWSLRFVTCSSVKKIFAKLLLNKKMGDNAEASTRSGLWKNIGLQLY